jgi:hypothetical protein
LFCLEAKFFSPPFLHRFASKRNERRTLFEIHGSLQQAGDPQCGLQQYSGNAAHYLDDEITTGIESRVGLRAGIWSIFWVCKHRITPFERAKSQLSCLLYVYMDVLFIPVFIFSTSYFRQPACSYRRYTGESSN